MATFWFCFSSILLLLGPVRSLSDFHTNPFWIDKAFAILLNQSDFMSVNYKICPKLGLGIKLLMVVTSAADHELARLDIRKTWGHFAARKDVAMMFLMGSSLNGSVDSDVEKENDLYNDIIRLKIIDTYDNLTLKALSMLMWTDIYCPKSLFLLKVDDDMYINVDRLLNFIETLKPDQRFIYGQLEGGWKPSRDPKTPHYISYQQYESDNPVDYVSGPAYLLPVSVIQELYTNALQYKYIQVEDVFIVGIIADSLKIQRNAAPGFLNGFEKPTPCIAQQKISIHGMSHHEKFDMWAKLHDFNAQC